MTQHQNNTMIAFHYQMNRLVGAFQVTGKWWPTKLTLYPLFAWRNGSSFCNRFALPEGESIQAFVPHVSGLYNDLSNDDQENINLVFSWKCGIFGVNGARCSEWNEVFKMENIKRQRKEKCIRINPKCNKRYLLKEEVVLKLKQERNNRINAEEREVLEREIWKRVLQDGWWG